MNISSLEFVAFYCISATEIKNRYYCVNCVLVLRRLVKMFSTVNKYFSLKEIIVISSGWLQFYILHQFTSVFNLFTRIVYTNGINIESQYSQALYQNKTSQPQGPLEHKDDRLRAADYTPSESESIYINLFLY